MARAMMNFVLPLAAMAMIATVVAFPSPQSFNRAIAEAASPFLVEPVLRGATDARVLIQDYASAVPGLTQQLEDSRDCFVGLDTATPEKLRDCAPAVTNIIAQIVAHQDNPVVARALENEGNGKLLPQIQVAAAEVCRSIWASGDTPSTHLDNPACQMAQVALVPQSDLR